APEPQQPPQRAQRPRCSGTADPEPVRPLSSTLQPEKQTAPASEESSPTGAVVIASRSHQWQLSLNAGSWKRENRRRGLGPTAWTRSLRLITVSGSTYGRVEEFTGHSISP